MLRIRICIRIAAGVSAATLGRVCPWIFILRLFFSFLRGLPLLLLAQLVLTLGLALFLSMAHFLWRDVGSAVAFGLQLWFYVTPIVYPLSQVPERFYGWFLLNPLACLTLMVQSVVLHMPPPVGTPWALAAWVVALGGGGWWFFRSMKAALGEAL